MAEFKGKIYGTCAEGGTVRTGVGKCGVVPGKIVGLLLADANARFPLDPTEFKDALADNIASGKLIPIKPIVDNRPGGGDARTSSTGYGATTPNGVNPPTYAFEIGGGTACQYKELTKLNRQTKRIFEIDDAGIIFGTVITEGGVDKFAGYLGYTQARNTKATGTDAGYKLYLDVYYTEARFGIEERDLHGFEIGETPDGLVGIMFNQDTNGVITIVEACGGTEVGSSLAADWKPAHAISDTGAAATNFVVAPDTGVVTITPAGNYRIASAPVLAADGIIGFDGVKEFVTVTVTP